MISEAEFERICTGIRADRDAILKHNPIGKPDETLLWMLMSCLVSYLSLTDMQTPCFNGRPDKKKYRDAILFILKDRKTDDFDESAHLDKLLK